MHTPAIPVSCIASTRDGDGVLVDFPRVHTDGIRMIYAVAKILFPRSIRKWLPDVIPAKMARRTLQD